MAKLLEQSLMSFFFCSVLLGQKIENKQNKNQDKKIIRCESMLIRGEVKIMEFWKLKTTRRRRRVRPVA